MIASVKLVPLIRINSFRTEIIELSWCHRLLVRDIYWGCEGWCLLRLVVSLQKSIIGIMFSCQI
jgi:hypothetical protein